jgi:starch phosphorylase
MKAAMNGAPNLSTLDGWWNEGYDSGNGWAFGGEAIQGDQTASDTAALYQLLEEKVIPLYYERSDDGIPHGFVKVMKAAIQSVAPPSAPAGWPRNMSICSTPPRWTLPENEVHFYQPAG